LQVIVIYLLVGVLAGIAARLYYNIVFLPCFYGSFTASVARLETWDAWWVFFKSPIGLILHALILAFFSVTILALFAPHPRGR